MSMNVYILKKKKQSHKRGIEETDNQSLNHIFEIINFHVNELNS